MDVYWLEQSEADVPVENDWLRASEVARLDSMRFAKRRDDWRLGRWTAKRALAACLNVSGHPRTLSDIELRPAPSGAPEVFFANKPMPVSISLSHRSAVAACAVALSEGALGCDLEAIEPHSEAFVEDYFTAEEQALVAWVTAADRPRLLAVLWSAKESALKALRAGLRLDTRCVSVSLVDALQPEGGNGGQRLDDRPLATRSSLGAQDWRPLLVHCTEEQLFHGWWYHTSGLVRTLVAAPPPVSPILVDIQKALKY